MAESAHCHDIATIIVLFDSNFLFHHLKLAELLTEVFRNIDCLSSHLLWILFIVGCLGCDWLTRCDHGDLFRLFNYIVVGVGGGLLRTEASKFDS